MYEFTHGGLWFKWSALDRRSKWLAGLSLAAAFAGALPLGAAAGAAGRETGYRLGQLATEGRIEGAVPAEPAFGVAFTPPLAWISIVLFVVSGVLWWRFSLRQDEMFNRVQNWAFGMGGAWTMALLSIWAVLALAGAAPAVSPLALIALFWVGVMAFWMVAVRRWA